MIGIARLAHGALELEAPAERQTDQQEPDDGLDEDEEDGDGKPEVALGLEGREPARREHTNARSACRSLTAAAYASSALAATHIVIICERTATRAKGEEGITGPPL